MNIKPETLIINGLFVVAGLVLYEKFVEPKISEVIGG